MIPMSCPSCGRRGTIPPDRLNTRMHCKKCDAVFYMDGGGKMVLGEPPSARAKDTAAAGKKGAKPKSKKDQNLDPIGELLRSPVLKKIGIGLAGAVALLLLGSSLMRALRPTVKGLVEFNEDAARAVVTKDVEALKRLAAPGTEADVAAWYDKITPLVGDVLGSDTVEDVGLAFKLTNETPDEREAESTIHIVPPISMMATEQKLQRAATAAAEKKDKKGPKPPMRDLDMCWIKDGKVYRLDGTKTLELLPKEEVPEKGKAKKKK